MAEKKKEVIEPTFKFTKEQVVHSAKFSEFRDLLNGNLEDNQEYSISEIETLIADFKKGGK